MASNKINGNDLVFFPNSIILFLFKKRRALTNFLGRIDSQEGQFSFFSRNRICYDLCASFNIHKFILF